MWRIRRWLLLGFLALPLSGVAMTLKIATAMPDGTAWMQALRDGAEEIKQRTGGRVEIRFYPGGVMGNDRSVLRKIRVGQLHGGVITGGGLAEIHPDAQIYSLPFIFQNLAEVDYVRGRMDRSLIADLAEKGFVAFGISEGGFANLMSTSTVLTLEDLQPLKVWVPEGDAISQTAFQAVGIQPVALPLTDVLTGLQTGLIDTVAATSVGAIALQWHTRVKYLTDAPLSYIYGSMVISSRAFNRLEEADRAVVQEVFGQVFRELNARNREDERRAREVLQQQGIRIISLQQDDSWHDAVEQATRRLSERQVFSEEKLQLLQRHLDEFRNQEREERGQQTVE